VVREERHAERTVEGTYPVSWAAPPARCAPVFRYIYINVRFTCMFIYVYVCVCVYICMYIYICVYVCISIYVFRRVCVYIYIDICTRWYRLVQTHVDTCFYETELYNNRYCYQQTWPMHKTGHEVCPQI